MKINPPPRIQTILLAVLAIGIISIAFGDAYAQTNNPPTINITNHSPTISTTTNLPTDADQAHAYYFTLFGATCTDTEDVTIAPASNTSPYFTAYVTSGAPDYNILTQDTAAAGSWTVEFSCGDSDNNRVTETRTLQYGTGTNTPSTPTPTTSSFEFIPLPPNTVTQIFYDLWHVQVKSPYSSGAVWETYLLERDISGWEKTYEVTKIAFLKAGYYDANDNFLYGFGEWKTIYLNSQSP